MTRTRWGRGAVVTLVGLVGLVGLVCSTSVLVWSGRASVPRDVAAHPSADVVRLRAGDHHGALSVDGGVVGPLRPGRSGVIDVHLANRDGEPTRLRRLEVSIGTIEAPRATGSRDCGPADFEVVQGDLVGLLLDAGSSTSLSQAGIDPARWPRLRMLAGEHDQNGCQGARLRLVFEVETRTS